MGIFSWLTGRRSVRGSVLALYKRGLSRAVKHDPDGAMEAYSAAIKQPDAPEDLKAMALYNRALLFAAEGEDAKAVADLEAVLATPAELREIKAAAKRRLERMQHRKDLTAELRSARRRPTDELAGE